MTAVADRAACSTPASAHASALDAQQDPIGEDVLDLHIAIVGSASSFEAAWSGFAQEKTHETFCDQFARRVAERYLAGELSYEVADRAMNGLYAYCYHLDSDRGMSGYAWAVFDAFEAGEYVHEGDGPEASPDETYVVPLLRKLCV